MAADRPLRLWAFGCAHVGSDLRISRRESLAEAIRQSESGGPLGVPPPFDWDIALDIGDLSGGQQVPTDAEGAEVVRQFGALHAHARESIYNLCGNHDRSGLDEPPARWWRKWVDPLGENSAISGVVPARRPYPLEGTWERYSFRVGNLLFLVMSDINEPTQRKGRGPLGGNPAGVVSGATFDWWQLMVESNPDCLIISVHHYMLKDTTTATGEYEGFRRGPGGEWVSHYHGFKPEGAPQGASYLYFVDSQPDAQAFERYLAAHPAAVALWLGGHTHTTPDDTHGGKALVATKWGAHFINVAALTKDHNNRGQKTAPMSRRLTFIPGRAEVKVECYLHTAAFAAPGWYKPAERTLPLARPFKW
ncbi:MAG: hypothetical protein HYV35_12015 [Lentisphaerae bacterium]|nr:hypothetical protein [Lentisphaerota bacterium]